MKHFFCFCCLLFVFLPTIMAQEVNGYYYWYNGKKQVLELKPEKRFLLLDYEVDPDSLSRLLHVERDRVDEIQKVKNSKNHLSEGGAYWTVVSDKGDGMQDNILLFLATGLMTAESEPNI